MTFSEWLEFARATWRKDEGQTMAEYGVVLAVITIAAVGVFTALSGGITGTINKVTGLLCTRPVSPIRGCLTSLDTVIGGGATSVCRTTQYRSVLASSAASSSSVASGASRSEADADRLEADARVTVGAERPLQVEIALDLDLDAPDRDLHRRGDHLARDLRAGGERPEQQIARAGALPRAADAAVGLGLLDRAAEVDRAGDRGVTLPAAGREGDACARRVGAIAVLERALELPQVDFHQVPPCWLERKASTASTRR